jgi:MerR family transcriptional regulator, heat shock protein HspR
MKKEFWTRTEVVEFFHVDEGFLSSLEDEELLCPVCRDEAPTRVFPLQELEKLRLAKVLVEEMGVNMAGVEIILRMREMMFSMREQFDEILEDLAGNLRETGRAGE